MHSASKHTAATAFKTGFRPLRSVMGVLLVAGLLAAGCRAPDRTEVNPATIEVRGAARAQVGDTVRDVFQASGFSLVNRDKAGLVFERQASGWSNFAYGGWLDSQSIWVRAEVQVLPLDDLDFQLVCHPHLLMSKGEALEEEIKTARPRSGPFQKMLDDVGRRLAQPAR